MATSLGEHVREHRRTAGMTQEELAERAGLSPRSISELERGGAHVPRRDTVALLAQAFNLVGAERSAFEALVQRRRRDRSTPDQRRPATQTVAAQESNHNVPRSLTSFIGREQDLSELALVLPNAPLLTIVGAGGVGKTRLAQELIRTHAGAYSDGARLVELAGLTDPALVPNAVAAAIGLGRVQPCHMLGAVAEFLMHQHLLLVLDNCEHLIEACAEMVIHLTRFCPRLHVLVTGREPLAIDGEIIWRLLPLAVPDQCQFMTVEQIGSTPSVQLFMDRARAVNPTLSLSEANASALAQICRGVAGIPLALELAAARARVLTLEQLAERLAQDPEVLGHTNRTGLPQHRTMRATIDWSHDLLGEQEQVLLRRLAVFAGGWTLSTAEDVCSEAGIERSDVLDLLAQLVDKSMVLVDTRPAVARYRFLEPIRHYALERLEASGEAGAYRARHAAVVLDIAGTAAVVDYGPDEIASLDRMEVEHDNLRLALRWALTHQRSDQALRAAGALYRFWDGRGHFQEGCAWLEEALAIDAENGSGCHRGTALSALAGLYWRGGDLTRAQPIAEQALAASRRVGNIAAEGWALGNLGAIAYFGNQSDLAADWLEQSVVAARQAGCLPLLSLALTFLGRALLCLDGPHAPRATTVLRESLRHAEVAGSRYAAGHALVTLGDLAWRVGDVEQAMRLWRQALVARSELADRRGIAGCFERLAWGLAATERFAFAACVFAAADAQHTVLGIDLRHDERIDHAEQLASVRERLSEEAFAAGWAAGQTCGVDEAVTRALDWTR